LSSILCDLRESIGAGWVPARRVDEVGGVERCSARFALVAIGARVVAVGTFAGDIAVGEELVGFFIIELHRSFLDEFAFFI
jgi:hypothetical protein